MGVVVSLGVWSPLMLPVADGADDWDYFCVVRYRSVRDLLEGVAEVTREHGSDAMLTLKHSGVERTLAMPITAVWLSNAVRLFVGAGVFKIVMVMRSQVL